MIEIWITQPTGCSYYGPETTPEAAVICAKNCLDLALAFARKHWPDAKITGRLVPETVSRSNRTAACDADGIPANAIAEHIDRYIEDHWNEEPLWSTDFDPQVYLEETDR